jgi:ATP-dependent Zn protease
MIPLPDQAGLVRILRHHLGADLADEDLSPVALEALGATGADAARIVRDARRLARQQDRPLALDGLHRADRGLAADRQRTSEYRWTIAVHEAGHALVGTLDAPTSVTKVSIRDPMTISGNVGSQLTKLDSGPITRLRIDRLLRRLLAGRAAEDVLLGEVSAGAGGRPTSDLAKATWLSCAAFGSFGLGDEGTLLWLCLPTMEDVSSFLLMRPQLAEQVATKLSATYGEVVNQIRKHRRTVECIAQALVKRGVLDGAEVRQLVGEKPRRGSHSRKPQTDAKPA